MHEYHAAHVSPVGWLLLFGGGVVAQVVPSTPVGTAGLIASIAGLLMAVFQYYSKWMDGKNHERLIQEQGATIRDQGRDLAEIKQELAVERKARAEEQEDNARKRHDIRDKLSGEIGAMENRLFDREVENGRLKAELKVLSERHSRAINANTDNVAAVAEQTGSTLPIESPRVAPIGAVPAPEARPE